MNLMGLRRLKLKPMSSSTSCTIPVHLYCSPSARRSPQLSDCTGGDASHSGWRVTQKTTSLSVENEYQWLAEPQMSITPPSCKAQAPLKTVVQYRRDQTRVGLKIILIVVETMLSA